MVSPCVIDFNAFADTIVIPDFETGEDFSFTLGYEPTTREISSIFEIPSGEPATIILNVSVEDALGTSICTDTITSSSGTLSCIVGKSIGNTTVLAKLYREGSLQAQGNINLGKTSKEIYGGVLVFLALIVMISLIGIGVSDNPVYTVLFLMLGIIILFSIKLVSSEGFIGGTILWLIIAIILIAIKGGKRS